VKDMEDMTDVVRWIRRPRFIFRTCISTQALPIASCASLIAADRLAASPLVRILSLSKIESFHFHEEPLPDLMTVNSTPQ